MRFVFATIFSLIFTPAHADDFQEGSAAYERRDYATALAKFRLAADRGSAEAQLNLGLMYYNGLGVQQDYKEAERRYKLAIRQPPRGLQSRWRFIRPTKYLFISDLKIHVFATPSVPDSMMVQSFVLITHMVSALKNTNDRAKFAGHQTFLITDSDPDLAGFGGREGQRNTGGDGFSLFNTSLICTTAVDTLRPYSPPTYRAWDTPVHEFGHAIEFTLGLQGRSDTAFALNAPRYDVSLAREYFPWAVGLWFDADPSGTGRKRDDLLSWENDYLSSVFSKSSTWTTKNDPRLCGYNSSMPR